MRPGRSGSGTPISAGCGSAIGGGISVRKTGTPAPVSAQVTGFIRVTAADLGRAKALLDGNSVYEAGGTVEIRELPTD